MPTYLYECCGERFEVVKGISLSDEAEKCKTCGGIAEKKINFRGGLAFGTFVPAYQPALGKVITDKRELRNELAAYKDRTGSELVEVGTDRSKPKKPTPKPLDKRDVIDYYKARLKDGRSY